MTKTMKLRIVLLALLVFVSTRIYAQTSSLGQYLESCPFLSEVNKKALIIREEQEPRTLDAVFSTPTSSLSSCYIRLYPMVNGTPLIAVIERIREPSLDCSLSFYTPEWVIIEPEALIRLPQGEDFLSHFEGNGSVEAARLRQLLYPLHYDISWGDEGSVIITASLSLSQEDKQSEALKDLIDRLPKYRFEWKNYRFEAMK